MIAIQTPLRISLAGGGTDSPMYFSNYGGLVVSLTIDQFATVIISERDTPAPQRYKWVENHLRYTDLMDANIKVDTDRHGINLLAGGGLGNSSAMSVGLLRALYRYKNQDVPDKKIAASACKLLSDLHGVDKVGFQDEFACTYRGLNGISFSNFIDKKLFDVHVRPFRNKLGHQLSESLMLFELPIQSRDSDFMMEMQNRDVSNATEIRYNIKLLSQMLYDHLVTKDQVDVELLGDILDKGWNLKKQLAPQMSSSIINLVYDKAIGAGALGGKVCGSGGGGYLLLCCEPHKQENLRDRMMPHKELHFNYHPRSDILWSSP